MRFLLAFLAAAAVVLALLLAAAAVMRPADPEPVHESVPIVVPDMD